MQTNSPKPPEIAQKAIILHTFSDPGRYFHYTRSISVYPNPPVLKALSCNGLSVAWQEVIVGREKFNYHPEMIGQDGAFCFHLPKPASNRTGGLTENSPVKRDANLGYVY